MTHTPFPEFGEYPPSPGLKTLTQLDDILSGVFARDDLPTRTLAEQLELRVSMISVNPQLHDEFMDWVEAYFAENQPPMPMHGYAESPIWRIIACLEHMTGIQRSFHGDERDDHVQSMIESNFIHHLMWQTRLETLWKSRYPNFWDALLREEWKAQKKGEVIGASFDALESGEIEDEDLESGEIEYEDLESGEIEYEDLEPYRSAAFLAIDQQADQMVFYPPASSAVGYSQQQSTLS